MSLPPIQLNTEEKKQRRGRRILTGYQCFVSEQKSELLKNDASLNETQISKQLANKWKQMTAKQKQKYISHAQQVVNNLLVDK